MSGSSGEGNRREPPAVAVVDASTPGNVGTIARAMKNFGFEDLLLVDPPVLEPDGDAYGFAGQARADILPSATELSFSRLVEEYHTVGFTATPNEDDRRHIRFPVSTPTELVAQLRSVAGPTALVFGRERVGLTNEELSAIDRVCTIPANPAYPVLNLGQAATIALYELRSLAIEADQLPDIERTRADPADVQRLLERWEALLGAIDHPTEKREKATRLLQRVQGRADSTGREVATLEGILRTATEQATR
ncbi:MAG: RNA methyltransferase [Natrialbaceae archaeon]|nr:RNA methyltransferase [Natrialbaceae archaeon]